MADTDANTRTDSSRSSEPSLTRGELRGLFFLAALAALAAGGLSVGSELSELLHGNLNQFGWADGLGLGAILPGLLVMVAFLTLGDLLSSKTFRVSVGAFYLSGCSLTAAGFAASDWLPFWVRFILGILALLLLVGGFVYIGEAYPTIGTGLKVVKTLTVLALLSYWWANDRDGAIVMPVLISVYWPVAIATGVFTWSWFSVSLIRERHSAGLFSALLGWAQIASFFVLLGIGIWAFAVSAEPYAPNLFAEEAAADIVQPILWGFVVLDPLLTVLTTLLFLSVRNSHLIERKTRLENASPKHLAEQRATADGGG